MADRHPVTRRPTPLALLALGAAVVLAVACSTAESRARAVQSADSFVDEMSSMGLTGRTCGAVRHGPWWEVSVDLERGGPIVLFIDPDSFRVEYVERRPGDTVPVAEFRSDPLGLPA